MKQPLLVQLAGAPQDVLSVRGYDVELETALDGEGNLDTWAVTGTLQTKQSRDPTGDEQSDR